MLSCDEMTVFARAARTKRHGLTTILYAAQQHVSDPQWSAIWCKKLDAHHGAEDACRDSADVDGCLTDSIGKRGANRREK